MLASAGPGDRTHHMFSFSSNRFAIDLGTARLRVAKSGSDTIVDEASSVVLQKRTGALLLAGDEALAAVERTPRHAEVVFPVKDGVMADAEAAALLIQHILKKGNKDRTPARFHLTLGVPTGLTRVERNAYLEAGARSGAAEVELVETTLAAAAGLRLPRKDPKAHLICEIGAGQCQVALLSMGGVAQACRIRGGGEEWTRAIRAYVRSAHHLLIGTPTATEVKHHLADLNPLNEAEQAPRLLVQGRDLITSIPRSLKLHAEELGAAILPQAEKIGQTIRQTLQGCSAELTGDLVDRGILLCGSGAHLRGLTEWLASHLDCPVHLAEDPHQAVIRGLSHFMNEPSDLPQAGD